MTWPEVLVRALVVAAVGIAVTAAWALLVVRDVLGAVHLVSAVTSVAVPLLGVAVAVQQGWSLSSGEVLLTVLGVAVTAPALSSATARLAAQRRGLVEVRGHPREPAREEESA